MIGAGERLTRRLGAQDPRRDRTAGMRTSGPGGLSRAPEGRRERGCENAWWFRNRWLILVVLVSMCVMVNIFMASTIISDGRPEGAGPRVPSSRGAPAGHDGRRTGENGEQLPACPHPPPNLGPLAVDLEGDSVENIENRHKKVLQPGGRWRPNDCIAKQKVALLIPYRDRESDLQIFFNNIHNFLQKQYLHYGIYLIEQGDIHHFNRGTLLNVGYQMSMKDEDYDCIILHDIDKFPEDTRNLYHCGENPIHLFARRKYKKNEEKYRNSPYGAYFGGVSAVSPKQFSRANGFSNMFWGWGSEDDDFYNRMVNKGYSMERRPVEIGSYREIWHPYGFVNPRRHEIVVEGKARYDTDGLNSLDNHYTLKHIKREVLYTKIVVKLKGPENAAEPTVKESKNS